MDTQRFSKQTRYIVFAVVIGLTAIAGIWYATSVRLGDRNGVQPDSGGDRIISSIMVGSLLSSTEAKKPNPRLDQKSAYTTNDQIVMRITSEPTVKEPFEVGVRLLEKSGKVVELDPSSVTFKPGTSSFCCWNITKEGDYTLQIFRPEKIISTIPLAIKQSIEGGGNYNSFSLF